jgi:hypothetical protein
MKNSFKAIDLLFELAAIANPKARLLPLFVDACSIIPSTPTASWFDPVAFDFSRFTQFTTLRIR